jgi:hypothetical protein
VCANVDQGDAARRSIEVENNTVGASDSHRVQPRQPAAQWMEGESGLEWIGFQVPDHAIKP